MFDDFQEIFATIKRNKLRTFLTGFSMAWGIFMLIVLLGAGNGIRNGVMINFGDSAKNVVTLWPGNSSQPFEGLQKGRRTKLDATDGPFLENEFSALSSMAPQIIQWGTNVNYKGDYAVSELHGVNMYVKDIEEVKIYPGDGRFINEADLTAYRKVIVLHAKTAELLFKGKNPLGEHVTVHNVAYQVVGIYHDQNTMQTPSCYIPLTTAQRIYNPKDGYSTLSMRINGLDTNKENEQFEKDLRAAMGRKHQFAKEDYNALYVWNMWQEYMQFQGIFKGISAFLWVIGLGTLIAGVVGISNIMLITVKERTREFGIRKALGARPGTILRLILTECLMITGFFGYIGMLLGIGVTEILNAVIGTPAPTSSNESMVLFSNPTVEPGIIIAATLLLMVAGLLAGYVPARKAVRVKPIEALRYE